MQLNSNSVADARAFFSYVIIFWTRWLGNTFVNDHSAC